MTKHATFVEAWAVRRLLFGTLTLLALLLTATRPTAASRLTQAVTPIATPSSATSQPPSPTPATQPLDSPTTLWQAETPAWLTALGILITSIITGAGWFVTQKQQRALATEQRQLARLQERMIRERALASSNADKLRALGEYLEFPNRISSCLDPQTIRHRYDQEWECQFGLYRAYAFRYDELAFKNDPGGADSDNLGQLLNQIDVCIDDWVQALTAGVDLRTASNRHLIQAMESVKAAVKRLDDIERRLLLDDTPIPDEPARATN